MNQKNNKTRLWRQVGALIAAAVLLLGSAYTRPAQASGALVQIVEVMNQTSAADEWIALANVGGSDVNLSGWKLADYSATGVQQTPWSFPAGTVIPAHTLLVVEKTAGISGAGSHGVPALPGGNFNISASSDRVDLLNASSALVDAVAWGSGNQAEGFSLSGLNLASGQSVERSSSVDTDSAANWTKAAAPEAWTWAPLAAVPDTAAPALTATTPANTATGVPLNAVIELQYNEALVKGSGSLTITNAATNQVFAGVSVANAAVSVGGFGSRTLTYDPPGDFAAGQTYRVRLDAGAVKDAAGNAAAAAQWTFTTGTASAGQVKVHFIDVGQGDGIYIQLPNHQDIVIDGGTWTASSVVRDYLVQQGVDDIELLIATHPDADHIGGLANILQQFTVEKIIDDGLVSGSATYQNYWNAVQNEITGEHAVYATENDQTWNFGGNISLTVLGPAPGCAGETNNCSIVVRLDTGSVEFLFTGDAEFAEENAIISRAAGRGFDMTAEFLKVGHHGSAGSTSEALLNAVHPRFGIISVGAGNTYGHPTQAALDRLSNANAQVWRTDQSGTIVVTTDGQSASINGTPVLP